MPPTPRSNRQVSNNDTNLSILEQNQTILTQLLVKNQQKESDAGQAKERRERLRRKKSFDGNNKGNCITWVDQTELVAEELSIPLRQAMMETAEGSVYNALSSLGRVSDKDLIDHMIEAFSDIPTQEDAIDKLRTLRRKDEALIAFNATYTAIHRRAYDCEPVNQVRICQHLGQGLCKLPELPNLQTERHPLTHIRRCNGEGQRHGNTGMKEQSLQRQERFGRWLNPYHPDYPN